MEEGIKFYTDSPVFSKYSERKNIKRSSENIDISDEENEIDKKYFNESKRLQKPQFGISIIKE